MKIKFSTLLVVWGVALGLLISPLAFAQNASLADHDNMSGIVNRLSDPLFAGRLTGTAGNEGAARFILAYFDKLGIESHIQWYSQPVMVQHHVPTLEIVTDKGEVVTAFAPVYDFAISTSPGCALSGEVMAPLNLVRDEAELIAADKHRDIVLLVSEAALQKMSINVLMNRISSMPNVQGVILEANMERLGHFPATLYVNPSLASYENGRLLVASASANAFSQLAKVAKTKSRIRAAWDYGVETANVGNVVGVIPGQSGEEQLIIGAHFDGSGSLNSDLYFPGAHDNASGVAVVLEVARMIQELDSPPYPSIVFIAFNGEEQGIYGSRYYVENPVLPLLGAKMINIDSVGTAKPIPLQIESYPGTSTALRDRLFEFGEGTMIQKGESRGVDHTPFAQSGVEAINITQPDWMAMHGPTDTPLTLSIEKLGEVADMIFRYLRSVAY